MQFCSLQTKKYRFCATLNWKENRKSIRSKIHFIMFDIFIHKVLKKLKLWIKNHLNGTQRYNLMLSHCERYFMASTIALNIFIIIERAIIRVEESQQAHLVNKFSTIIILTSKKYELYFGFIAKWTIAYSRTFILFKYSL